jgi:DNA-3-methyladenine glycosylase
MSRRGRGLARSFYARSSLEVAPELLNKVLVRGELAMRIVEVEAYAGADDPASHAFGGRTERNATMFGPAGHLYVYFTYGMHWCANVVCGPPGVPTAVLLRAGAPMRGLEQMRQARDVGRSVARRDRDLGSGPARLAQALGIDRALDGADLVPAGSEIRIVDDGVGPPDRPGRSERIGIRLATDRPWRWYVPGDPNLSRRR